MRPLMWTLGAFRPNAQLFALLSTWFYRHPGMSSFRPSLSKALEEPSELSASFLSEVNTCRVRLSGDMPTLLDSPSKFIFLTVGCCRHQRVPSTLVKTTTDADKSEKQHTCALLWRIRCRCRCKRSYSRTRGHVVQRHAGSMRRPRRMRRDHALGDGHDEQHSAFSVVGIG